MNEKEIAIIEAAIKLFAQKGFSSTSIQEIAISSGISKGAFYLHFKSKEALLLAILNYYFEQLKDEILNYEDDDTEPKEVFLKQLNGFLRNSIQHHEFIIMISREQSIPLNDSTKKLISKMQIEIHAIYHKAFLEIFGEEAMPYLWDLSVMAEGIMNSYIKVLLFNKENLHLERLSQFIFNRIETIFKDLSSGKEESVLTQEAMMKLLDKTNAFLEKDTEDITTVIKKMKQILTCHGSLENSADLNVSLEVIEAELLRQSPRAAVFQGMLSNFKGLSLFDEELAQLTNYIKSLAK